MDDEDMRDTTRPTNDNFGINWGYKADLMIKERIDSGDLLFVKYDCDKSISLYDMANCYKNQLSSFEGSYDNVLMTVRNLENLHVIQDSEGKGFTQEYSVFLASPNIQEVVMRKLRIKDADEEFNKAFGAY